MFKIEPLIKTIILATFLFLFFGVNGSGAEELAPVLPDKTFKTVSKERQDAILKEIEDKLHSVKGLKAKFVQERHIALFLDILTSEGMLYFKAPDKLRWELSAPYRSMMLFNNKKVAKFRIKEGQLEKAKFGMENLLRGMLEQIISILKGDFDKAREGYDMEILEGKEYLLHLKPKSEGMAKAISSLELFFDPASLQMSRIIIREPQEDFMEIKFFSHEVDPDLPDDLFNVNKPSIF